MYRVDRPAGACHYYMWQNYHVQLTTVMEWLKAKGLYSRL